MLKNEWSRVYESSKVNGERDERVKGPVRMECLPTYEYEYAPGMVCWKDGKMEVDNHRLS